MKKIPYVGKVKIKNLMGEVLKDDAGAERSTDHFEFFMGRLEDPAFVEGKEGLAGVCFVVTTRIELENQRDEAKKRGFWLLEDDRAAALQRATLSPKNAYLSGFALTVIELAQPLEKLEAWKGK